MRLQQEAALSHGKYRLDRLADLSAEDETRLLLGLMVVAMLDRGRYSGL